MCMCVANQYSLQLLKENMRDGCGDTGHRQTVIDKMEENESRRVREKTLAGGEDAESRKESDGLARREDKRGL